MNYDIWFIYTYTSTISHRIGNIIIMKPYAIGIQYLNTFFILSTVEFYHNVGASFSLYVCLRPFKCVAFLSGDDARLMDLRILRAKILTTLSPQLKHEKETCHFHVTPRVWLNRNDKTYTSLFSVLKYGHWKCDRKILGFLRISSMDDAGYYKIRISPGTSV